MVRVTLALAAALALLLTGAAASGASEDARFSAPAVEGHSTFVTLDIAPRAPAPVLGLAVCKQTVTMPGFLHSLLSAFDSCQEDLQAVYATPPGMPDPTQQALTATGRERSHVDANGVEWTTVEYAWPLASGATGVTYAVLVDELRTHPQTGEEYNFVLAQPAGGDWDSLVLSGGRAP